jgi:hypothetical protein
MRAAVGAAREAVRSSAQMVGRVVIAAKTLIYIGAMLAEQGEVCVNSGPNGRRCSELSVVLASAS